jgi:glycerol-3-phosphate cytidylyltransferase
MKRYKTGYTQGVFDMFHIGHLNLLNAAKESCEYLIVGVNTDELVLDYKNKLPVINEDDRKKIVENIKVVDEVYLVNTLNKMETLKKLSFDVIYIGDDWKKNERWQKTKQSLESFGIDVVFLPYTKDISSTILRKNRKCEDEE